jgi:hypothetical protein
VFRNFCEVASVILLWWCIPVLLSFIQEAEAGGLCI